MRSKFQQHAEAAPGHRPAGRPSVLLLLSLALSLSAIQCGPPPPDSFVADDFNACVVDTGLWEFVDPRGNSSFSIVDAGAGAAVEISVPSGANHDPWTVNESARLLQPMPNADFRIDAKFDSAVTQAYQGQGLMVEEALGRYFRFDTHYNGSSQVLFGATFDGGVATVRFSQPIPVTNPIYLQIEREGDLWRPRYSTDGLVWIDMPSFADVMAVERAGIFASNYQAGGNPPAHVARVDYMVDDAGPVARPDGAPVPSQVTFATTVSGAGTVSALPSGSPLACGTEVALTATPDPGQELVGWGGAVTGKANPTSVLLLEDSTVHAVFAPDTTPPGVSNIEILAGPQGAVVRWQTDEPSDGLVFYGETTGYELGSAASSASLAVQHEVVLEPLASDTPHHLQIEASDANGNTGQTADQPFTTTVANGASPSGLFSDDFNACVIDPVVWDVVDPFGDATFTVVGAGSGDASVEISIPGDMEHEPGRVNLAPRLMQTASDTDFEVEVRFVSDVTEEYQEQGIAIDGPLGEWLRLDFFSDGTNRFLFAAVFTPTTTTQYGLKQIPSGGDALWMRVLRVGDQWTVSWSFDGQAWTQAASFNHVMQVVGVGIFAGNEDGGGGPPAHTAAIDWFNVVATPPVPEDTGALPTQTTLTVTPNGPGTIDVDPDQPVYSCGETVTLTAVPDPGFQLDAWTGDLSGDENPQQLSMTSNRDVGADFVLDTVPPTIVSYEVLRGPSSALVSWSTDEPTTGVVSYGLTPGYELGSVSDPAFTRDHSVVVPGLDPAETYHLEIAATDGAPFTTYSGDIVSGPSEGPDIVLFYGLDQTFGVAGVGQPMINLLGNVSDSEGVSSITWSVNGGPPSGLSIGANPTRLDQDGDFNAEIPMAVLVQGQNDVVLRAMDGLGNESAVSVTLNYDRSSIPGVPFLVDFSVVSDIQDVAQVVDGEWALEPAGLRIQELGYDRLLTFGDLTWTDYEATVLVTLHSIEEAWGPPSNGSAVGLIPRWPGHTPDGQQPAVRFWPNGSYANYRWQLLQNQTIQQSLNLVDGLTWKGSAPGLGLVDGDRFYLKVRIETLPDGSSFYGYKAWKFVDPEPAGWAITATEAPGTDVPSGSLLFVAHHADVTLEQVDIQPITP